MADLNSNLSNEHVIYHQNYKFGKENNLGSFSKAIWDGDINLPYT